MSTVGPTAPGSSSSPPPSGDDGWDEAIPGSAASAISVVVGGLVLVGLIAFALRERRKDARKAHQPFDFSETLQSLYEAGRIGVDCGTQTPDPRHNGAIGGRESDVTSPVRAARRSVTPPRDVVVALHGTIGGLPPAWTPLELDRRALRIHPPPVLEVVPGSTEGRVEKSDTAALPPMEVTTGTLLLRPSGRRRDDDPVKVPLQHEVHGGTEEVQVSILTLAAVHTKQDATQFVEEAALSWFCSHLNIQQTFGVVTAGSPRYLVQELCVHGNLQTYLQRLAGGDVLPVQDPETVSSWRLDVLRGIAGGMAFLEDQQIVHRDLAAGNVLLDQFLSPKITGFGVGGTAVALTAAQTPADDMEDPRVLAPLRWVDPDVLDVGWFSRASDVWAFGVTAIELFCDGATPYAGWTVRYMIDRVRGGYRLPQPQECPNSIYMYAILPCWRAAASRLSFADLQTRLATAHPQSPDLLARSPDLYSRHGPGSMYSPESPDTVGTDRTSPPPLPQRYVSEKVVMMSAPPRSAAVIDVCQHEEEGVDCTVVVAPALDKPDSGVAGGVDLTSIEATL